MMKKTLGPGLLRAREFPNRSMPQMVIAQMVITKNHTIETDEKLPE
jgi:hypothetical protein